MASPYVATKVTQKAVSRNASLPHKPSLFCPLSPEAYLLTGKEKACQSELVEDSSAEALPTMLRRISA